MEMDQSLGNQMDQEQPIAEITTVPKSWLDYGLILGGQLRWISWLLASGSFLQGFWTLPFGLAFLPFQVLSLLCLCGLVIRKRYSFVPLLYQHRFDSKRPRWTIW